jgi:DNA processing protein
VIDRNELAAWLRLLETPGVGRDSARRLLASFGGPQAALDAGRAAQREVLDDVQAAKLAEAPESFEDLLRATWEWLGAGESGAPRRIVTLGDPAYPPRLLASPDPPLLLYAIGRIELLAGDSLAIVGSRNPTAQGRDNARAFARHASCAGLVVTSGLALGIDGAAHEGALEGPGSTIAVVGTGLDRVYPARHRALAHRIAREGLIVSEFPIGMPPLAQNFPVRNRIIAGLSLGTLVVEAALESGSLITARLAAEAGREVLAIPGSIHSPQSRGCHWLIKQGAKLVDSAADILEELKLSSPAAGRKAAMPADHAPDDPLLEAIGYDPVPLDSLVARTGRSAADLGARLLELELDGLVQRLPGQMFQRRVVA